MEFDARIVSVAKAPHGVAVVLDRTCFYPGGGGQPADRGTVGGARLLALQVNDAGDIVHVLKQPPAGEAAPGATVGCALDAAWRLDFMAQHTGQHLLSASLLQAGGLATVSVHFGEETTAVEVAAESVADTVLAQAEELANAVIRQNRRVTCRELDREEALALPLRRKPPEGERLRVVQIEGADWSACGGVHVASTGEIVMAKIASVERIRGRVRIHALMGTRAFADYGRKLVLARELSKLLTCGEGDILSRVAELAASERDLGRELRRLRVEQASALAAQAVEAARPFGLPRSPGDGPDAEVRQGLFVQQTFDGFGDEPVKAFVDRVLARPGRLLVVVDREPGGTDRNRDVPPGGTDRNRDVPPGGTDRNRDVPPGFRWTVAHSLGAGFDLPGIVAPIVKRLGLRGGGRGMIMKGSGTDAGTAEAFAEAVGKALGL
jgi:alanyl-tRNA synthetase